MNDTIDINYIKEKSLPELRKAGVLKSSLFGSFARGEAHQESDIDILVEFPENKSLFDLIELKQALEASLGRKTDVITYRSLSHLLRESVLREQIPLL